MTVRRRLLAVFGALLLLMALPAGFAVLGLTDLRNLAVEGRGRHATASLSMGRFEASLARFDLYLRSFLAAPGEGVRTEVHGALKVLDEETRRLEEVGYADAASELAPVVEALTVSTRQIEQLVEQDGGLGPATRAFSRTQPLVDEAGRRVAEAALSVDRQAEADFARAESISSSARTGTLIALLASLAVAGLVAAWTTGALTGPIRRLMEATGRVADGRFASPPELPYSREDEIGELSRSFRAMTRRLAELDRMKAEFVTVASHELKTPINVIRGYTELIEEELASEVTEHQGEILHGIAEQSEAMSRLVSRLMDISRLEAGTYRLEWEEIHLRDLMTGVMRAFDRAAEQEGVELSTEIEESAPRTLVVDVDIVRDEILGNLVSNAVKFTPEGGEVRVRAWGQDGAAVFEVSDTGPGIPDDHRSHIFEKYYQAERSRSMGSGLGLAIAREMIEAHGGTIRLADEAGAGAVFRLTLPVQGPG